MEIPEKFTITITVEFGGAEMIIEQVNRQLHEMYESHGATIMEERVVARSASFAHYDAKRLRDHLIDTVIIDNGRPNPWTTGPMIDGLCQKLGVDGIGREMDSRRGEREREATAAVKP